MERRELLNELFSISINDAGELESLPILLKDYTPNLDRLPQFLMRLGPGVCLFAIPISIVADVEDRLTGTTKPRASRTFSGKLRSSTAPALLRHSSMSNRLRTCKKTLPRKRPSGGSWNMRSSLRCESTCSHPRPC